MLHSATFLVFLSFPCFFSLSLPLALLLHFIKKMEHDFASRTRQTLPRFQVENLARNKAFYDRLLVIGAKKKATPGQLALAWLQHQGQDVAPIPGTTKPKNLEENIGALAVKLTDAEVKEIADAVPHNEIVGERYPEMFMQSTWLHTNSPPLSSWTGTK